MLLKIDPDSLHYRHFPKDFYRGEQLEWVKKYRTNGYTIATEAEDSITTLPYRFDRDSLIVDYGDYKVNYLPLPRYGLAERYDELYGLVAGSTYTVFDSIRLEFDVNHILYSNQGDNWIGDREVWALYEMEGELFFVTGDLGITAHVQSFDANQFTTVIYGRPSQVWTFTRVSHPVSIKPDRLHGKWRRVQEVNNAPPPAFDFTDEPAVYPEELIVTDSTITRNYLWGSNDFTWFTNPGGDVLYISKQGRFRDYLHTERWELREISDDRLVIWRRELPSSISKFELVEFERLTK